MAPWSTRNWTCNEKPNSQFCSWARPSRTAGDVCPAKACSTARAKTTSIGSEGTSWVVLCGSACTYGGPGHYMLIATSSQTILFWVFYANCPFCSASITGHLPPLRRHRKLPGPVECARFYPRGQWQPHSPPGNAPRRDVPSDKPSWGLSSPPCPLEKWRHLKERASVHLRALCCWALRYNKPSAYWWRLIFRELWT